MKISKIVQPKIINVSNFWIFGMTKFGHRWLRSGRAFASLSKGQRFECGHCPWLGRDKHSGLLGPFISYEENKVNMIPETLSAV
jgi:hypothetical protein